MIKEEHIFGFNGEYQLAKYPPVKEGYYITVKCGLGGIYTRLNEWKDGKWQVQATDDSDVIAFSRNQVSKEEVEEWCKELMKGFVVTTEGVKNEERNI